MMTLTLLIGLWTTTCIQTQIAGVGQGHVVESYEIAESGDYKFTREWFNDAACTESQAQNVETGTIKLGARMGGFFATLNTFEADFMTSQGTDLGAITVKEGHSLKFGRGLKGSTFRNTMVGLFEYLKK